MSNTASLVAERDLQTEAQAAEAKLRELEADAERAERGAAAAQAAFDDAADVDDSQEKFVVCGVMAQQAKRLRKACEAHREAIAPLQSEAARERARVELDQLRRHLAAPALFDKARGRLTDVIADFRRDLAGAILEMQELVIDVNARSARANHLARSLGSGEQFAGVDIDRELAFIVDPLRDPQYLHLAHGDLRLQLHTGRGQQPYRDIIELSLTMRGAK